MQEAYQDGDSAPVRSTGNSEVIELLEYWLAEARRGEIFHAAIAVVKNHDQVAYDYSGIKGLEDRALMCLQTLSQELEAERKSRLLGPRNSGLDASHVEYHLTGTPICWDFLIWLVDAEMTRRRESAPAPLRVCFTSEDKLDTAGKDFFENVFRPLLPLVGAVEDGKAKGGRHKPVYVPYEICLAARAGEAVPLLRASDVAREKMELWTYGTRPITITLREAPHWSHRNSNVEAWVRFAKELERAGENVVFIRDTYKATEPLRDLATCPIAAWNVDLRMALYERSKCNMCVSNGPAGLLLFSSAPYIYFMNMRQGDKAYAPANPEWWHKSNGLYYGDQWPWALGSQTTVWETDDYVNLWRAWEQFQWNNTLKNSSG